MSTSLVPGRVTPVHRDTVDPAAALLFLDFPTGHSLQLSGTAAIEWDAAEPAGGAPDSGGGLDAIGRDIARPDQGPSRSVVFSPQALVALDRP